jgi:RNA polymerase sigma-70 factor (ECF subfamily)
MVIDAQRRLNAYILTLVPNLADADDVLQETNATLLRKQVEFELGTHFWPWACRVAYFEVLAFRRRRQRDRLACGFDDELLSQLGADAVAHFGNLDERLSALDDCMGRLTMKDRDLIHLRYCQQQDARQIAGRLGRTVRAVYQALYRIRNDLAQCVRRRVSAAEGTGTR